MVLKPQDLLIDSAQTIEWSSCDTVIHYAPCCAAGAPGCAARAHPAGSSRRDVVFVIRPVAVIIHSVAGSVVRSGSPRHARVLLGASCWIYQIFVGVGVAGMNNPVAWGTYLINFVFWVGIAHSATLISAILHLFRAGWRNPIARAAETMTVFAVCTAGLFPFIHLGRAWMVYYMLPFPNQRNLWPNFQSALMFDVVAISTYLTVSSLFWYTGMLPDLAIVRDNASGFRKKIFTVLSMG